MKKTNSNIELKTFYGNSNTSKPGEYPYKHGIYPNMYTDRLWTMRQYSGFSSTKESNRRYHYLLEQGVKGLSVAFDLPTQTGYDSDDSLSEGEVGKVGVPISCIEDMDSLLDGIPLDKISISMTINSTAAILLAFVIAIADKRGIKRSELRGTIQNDILKEYIARGTFIYPPHPSMKIVTDIFEYCSKELPNWNTISVSGYHIREAGSTAIQELAFTFSNAIAYVEAAIKQGLDVDKFASRISFFFNSHNHFFEEISKFRAARKIWSKIMKERFNAKNDKSMICRFHTQTAGSTLAAQEIDNNVVRTTLQATAAVLGGTQSLHTNSRDEALALPNEDSALLALRTQQIIAFESGVADVVDPLAGSYLIEELTDTLEKESFKLIKEIDNLGGAVDAIEQNFQQNKIADSAYDFQKDIDAKEKIQVGVNKFITEKIPYNDIQKIDQKAVDQQIKNLTKFKKNRDNNSVLNSLKNLKQVAENGDNIFPLIIESVKANATLGEISNTLRDIFGEHKG
tara:strand:- start:6667 stop:8205 length:1539 start_codon:yes stop_codon:yes gene_type:complete